jgi:type III restriction enzyme
VNHWGKLGKWDFHPCKDPQMLGRELEWLSDPASRRSGKTVPL